MRDIRLFIATLGAILVSICSSDSLSLEESAQDEPLRMASESLVVKSYKDAETTILPPSGSEENSGEYQGVMGRPGIDFPVYSAIPVTSFTCRGVKKSGYYADLETDCQVFHVCDRNRKISFLCPNGTIFRQSHLICDWWFRVDCGKSVELYDESAEQLEADQKIYKARSEERENRRKKLNRTLGSNLDGVRSEVQNRSNFNAKSSSESEKFKFSSTEEILGRSDGRKPQRHSKKVQDFSRTQTSSTGNENVLPPNHKSDPNELSVEGRELKAKLLASSQRLHAESVSAQKYSQPDQSLTAENYQENFYGAESGSLVKDLSQRSRNLVPQNKNSGERTHSLQQNSNGVLSGQKRNSKIVNLNTRERNEYFFNSHENSGSGQKTQFSNTEKFSSFGSTESENQGVTSGAFSSTEPQNYSFNAFSEQQSNKDINENYSYEYDLASPTAPPTHQESRIVQNGFSSAQVTGKTYQGSIGSPQTRFVSSSYRAAQLDVVKNGVGSTTQFEYNTHISSNRPSTFNNDELIGNIRNSKYSNKSLDFETTSTTTRPVHSFFSNTNNEGKNFSFGVRNEVNDFQKTSSLPATTTQQSYQQYEIQNENSDKNIEFNDYRKQQQSDVANQKTVTSFRYSTTAAPIQLPLRHESADFSYNSNANKEFSKQQNANNNYNTATGNSNNNQPFSTNQNYNQKFNGNQQQFSVGQANSANVRFTSQSNYSYQNLNSNNSGSQDFNNIHTKLNSKFVNNNYQQSTTTNGYKDFNQGLTSAYSEATQQSPQNYNQQNVNFGFTSQQNNAAIQPSSTGIAGNINVYNRNIYNNASNRNSFATGTGINRDNSGNSYTTATATNGYNNPNNGNSYTTATATNGYNSPNNGNSYTTATATNRYNSPNNGNSYTTATATNGYNSPNNGNSYTTATGTDEYRTVNSGNNYNTATGTKAYKSANIESNYNIANTGSNYNTAIGATGYNTATNANNYNSKEYTSSEKTEFKSGIGQELRSSKYSAAPEVGNFVKTTDFPPVTEGYKDDGASIIYTTENYESKRTNPIVRKESVTPAPFTIYSSSSPSYQNQEKQYLAETASFASNSGGNYFTGYRNQLDVSAKSNHQGSTTEKLYHTTFGASATTESYLTSSPVANQFSTVTTHYKTVSNTPVKQNSKKVPFSSSLESQPSINGPWPPATTIQPYYETATDVTSFNADNVYFTSTPRSTHQPELNLNYENNTLASEVNLSLQELNINKETSQSNVSDKTYEDLVREGLEVPPSSGPNAIRSFAVYFGNSNLTVENQTEPYAPVTHHADLTPTVSSFEIRKKEVVKQVDELVQRGAVNLTTKLHDAQEDKLPSSLTVHTKDSYLELFPKKAVETTQGTYPETTAKSQEYYKEPEAFVFGTTDFGAFTEEPTVINSELGINDLSLSQTRGIVEPEISDDSNDAHVTPDLRRLAQVFTKALSAYLDDPQAFRKILSEIRPTEPTLESEGYTYGINEYPSATREVDEVLDFSDVTKSTYKKKSPTVTATETDFTTIPITEIYNSSLSEVENLIIPVNKSHWATNIELTAPLLETLDESQSSYYTPLPFVGTTNQVAEEINGFIAQDKTTLPDANEDIDSYLPITTTDSPSTGKYGGFQNNNKKTTKYSPYGAELSSSPFPPLGVNSISRIADTSIVTSSPANTLSNANSTSFFRHFTENRTKENEIQLAKELNNLVLLQKFTTPRGTTPEVTTAHSHISTAHLSSGNDINQLLDVKLGNGETLERDVSTRGSKSVHLSNQNTKTHHFATTIKPHKVDLSSDSSTPKGFLITYSLENHGITPGQPTISNLEVKPTTYAPTRRTTFKVASETAPRHFEETLNPTLQSHFEYNGPPVQSTTPTFARAIKSLERIVELQEKLMFENQNSTVQQKDQARETVDRMMVNMNVTTSTTHTLMKMMEMAAKNETYKRLVLLLVNDKAAKNKTVEEARLSLLKALLTPVINSDKTVVPIHSTSKLVQPEEYEEGGSNRRRSKSITSDVTVNAGVLTTKVPTTTTTTITTTTTKTGSTSPAKTRTTAAGTTTASQNAKRIKVTRINLRNDKNLKKTDSGNLEVIRRTIENSKNKQIKINSIDESAILNSDSRAVELLKSLYSLAARWG